MTKKITGLKRLGLVGALIGSMIPGLNAEIVPTPTSARARVEHTDNTLDYTRTTAALANKDKGEFFRAYNYTGDTGDYNAGALATSAGTVYGTVGGDFDGIGIEPILTFGNTTLIVTGEKAQENHRVGAGLEQKAGAFTFGAGFDDFEIGGEDGRQALASTLYDATPNDLVGAAVVKDNDSTGGIVLYGHHGKDQNWGNRTWVKGDFADDSSDRTINFESIGVIGTPALNRKYVFPWLVDRGSYNGGMFGKKVTENSMAAERCPLTQRAVEGVVMSLCGTFAQVEDKETEGLKAEAGYSFPVINGIKTGATVSYNMIDCGNRDTDRIGGSIITSVPAFGGNLVGEVIVDGFVSPSRNPTEARKANSYIGLGYSKGF